MCQSKTEKCPTLAIGKETETEVFGRGISKLLIMEWLIE
jgi:hypothetical protein